MSEPLRARYVPGYDLFKLIVAVILTVILIMLLLRDSREKSAPVGPILPTPSLQEATITPESTPTYTATSEPSGTPSPTLEPPPTESPTAEPVPTEPPTPEPAPTDPPVTPDENACPSNPTRIQAGVKVKVLDWLNFRSGPGLNFPIQRTNRPGAEMEVIGGPVCTIKDGDPPRAYLWWNVKMQDGREGWSAEAPLNFPNYFLEPVIE
jgi:hypothetical protein